MEFLECYFKTLKKQCEIVRQKYGYIAAYSSLAFVTDLIPGIVMSFLFGQLKILSIPLQMALPNDYSALDQTRLMEEILLHVPLESVGNKTKVNNWDEFFKANVDSRILKIKVLPSSFIIVSSPPFKVMGEILKKVAIQFPSARVFRISNQDEVQVRISMRNATTNNLDEGGNSELQRIISLPGVKKVMNYIFPNTHILTTKNDHDMESESNTEGTSNFRQKVNYSFEVQCVALLDVIRTCNALPSCNIEQIYDFWN